MLPESAKEPADLSVPGAVEALVSDGRPPIHFCTLRALEDSGAMGPTQTTFWLPPKNTQLGDTIEGDVLIGFRFESPEGKDRGGARMHIVSQEIGKNIRTRTEAALQNVKN